MPTRERSSISIFGRPGAGRASCPSPSWNPSSSTYPGKDLVVIAVNVDHSRKKADAFLHEFRGGDVPIVYDEKGVLATKFHVEQMPTSILFDRDGKLRYVHKGFFMDKEGEYSSHVYDLINENQK